MKILFFILAVAKSVNSICPEHSEPWYEGVCGYIERSPTGDWIFNYSYAASTCQNLLSNLPSVHDKQEADLLSSAIFPNAEIWTGLTCTLVNNTPTFTWDDGTPFDYRIFWPGSDGVEFCDDKQTKYLYDRHDEVYNAGDRTGGMAQDAVVCTKRVPPEDFLCDDFSPGSSNGTCYKLFLAAKSWKDAESICAANGAHLYAIHSSEENDFVRRSAIANNMLQGVHIGLLRDTQNSDNWSWTDGSTNNFTNFISGRPDPNAGGCVALQPQNGGKWANEDCDVANLPFMCKRNAAIIQSSDCQQSILQANAEIYSPAYPIGGIFGSCIYTINVSIGKKAAIRVEKFDTFIYGHSFVADDGNGNEIARLSGHIETGTVYQSDTSVMTISWNSTTTSPYRGFHLTVLEL